MEDTEKKKEVENFEIDLKPGGFFTSGHFRISGTKEQVDEFFKEQEEKEYRELKLEAKLYKVIIIVTLFIFLASQLVFHVVEYCKSHYVPKHTNTEQAYKEVSESPVIGNSVYYPEHYQTHDRGSSSNGFFPHLFAHFDKKNSPCQTMEQKPTNSKAVYYAKDSVKGRFCQAKGWREYARAIMPQGNKKERTVGQNGQTVMFHFLTNRVEEQNFFTHSLTVWLV